MALINPYDAVQQAIDKAFVADICKATDVDIRFDPQTLNQVMFVCRWYIEYLRRLRML